MRHFALGDLVRVLGCDQLGSVIDRQGRSFYTVALPILGAVATLHASDMAPVAPDQGHELTGQLASIHKDALAYLDSFPFKGTGDLAVSV